MRQPEFFIEFIEELLRDFSFNRREIVIFTGENMPMKTKNFRLLHLHESWEIKILTGGEADFYFPGKVLKFTGPVITFMAPGVIHASSAPRNGGKMFIISFESRERWSALLSESAKREVYLDTATFRLWDQLLNSPHVAFLENALKLLDFGGNLLESAVSGMLEAFFGALGEAYRKTVISHPARESRTMIEQIEQFMYRDYFNPNLTIGQIADRLNITPNHLSFLFKKETGISPRRKLVEIRLKKAFALLKNGHNIKEAAWLTGWKSEYYFSREFKRFYKYPPSKVKLSMSL